MIKFTEKSKSKVKEYFQVLNKDGLALRIYVAKKEGNALDYQFIPEDWQGERPSDVVVREGGFATRMDPESANYLKGSTIDWTERDGMAGFSVDNPNHLSAAGSMEEIKKRIVDGIKSVYDPEIPQVNVYDLGLIYEIIINDERAVIVKMTLTAPNCPAAEMLPAAVEQVTKAVPGVTDCKIDLVWEPPWAKELMSEAARLELNL